MTATNTYSGTTTVVNTSSILRLGNGGGANGYINNFGSMLRWFQRDSILQADYTGSGTLGSVGGLGQFVQLGTGTTVFTGTNTYTGTTTITAGGIQAGNGTSAFGALTTTGVIHNWRTC